MKERLILFSLIVAAFFLRVFLIQKYSFVFAYDMGRDLLWSKDIAFYHIPTLIGPAASIWGIYFGPAWYYFLSIPLLLSRGNPVSAVYTTALVQVLTPLVAYLLFRNILNKKFLIIFTILLLFNATSISISTFAFHANMLPLLTLLVTYFCYQAIVKNPLYIALTFFTTSLMFHADPAPAVAFTFVPLFFFFRYRLYKTKPIGTITLSVIFYLLPFTPQIIFELRNNFVEVRSLVSYFSGNNPSLSGQLPLVPRIINRIIIFYNFFKFSFSPQSNPIALFLLGATFYGTINFLKNAKDKTAKLVLAINIYSLIIIFCVYTIFVTVEVKVWYLYGLTTTLTFLLAFTLYSVHKYKILQIFIISAITFLCTYNFLSAKVSVSKKDPGLFSNQQEAIDKIYEDAGRNTFSVYVFTPTIYDYSYQYLFWWQAVKLNKGLPQEFSYLPRVPSYVRNKQVYETRPASESKITYLIMENSQENEFYKKSDWTQNFNDKKAIWTKNINDAITIKKLE
ncbi:MAG: hypothetical protein AAB512_01420 [Patescibacteria group bacterium]